MRPRWHIVQGAALTALVALLAAAPPSADARPGSGRVVVLQKQGLKRLGARRGGARLVADYQRAFDTELGGLLRETGGRVIAANWRDVVIRSPLSKATLEREVVPELSRRVRDGLAGRRGRAPPGDLVVRVGVGATALEAHVDMKLGEFAMPSYQTWKTTTIALRRSLRRAMKAAGVRWGEALDASRRHGRDPAAMARWAAGRHLDPALGPALAEYGRLLTLADYLPASAAAALPTRAAPGRARYRLTTDLVNLGGVNRRAQDRWVAAGARFDRLASVHRSGTRAVQRSRQAIASAVTAALAGAQPIARDERSDETTWLLPDLEPAARRALEDRLSAIPGLRYALTVID